MRLWVQAVRRLNRPPSIESVVERLAYWKSYSGTLDAAYYLYIFYSILALDGSRVAVDEARRYIEECRQLARFRRKRTLSFEWLGTGSGLSRLVHYSELGEFIQGEFWSSPERLARVRGKIARIDEPQAGYIEMDGGLNTFFVPGRAGYSRSFSENRSVEFYLGFSYDGLRAWQVRDAQ